MPEPGRVVVAGASGLIGSALVASLRADGVPVTRLVRGEASASDEVSWLDGAPLDPDVLAGARAVVCLNGVSVGRPHWTASYKRKLLWSRITPTRTIATALQTLGDDAPAFVSGSAVGFYGPDPQGEVTETAPQGDSFLADLCGEWEHTARRAEDITRVALLRTAPLVDLDGVLKPLAVLTKWGLSGPLGRGTQVWPWIGTTDAIRAIRHVIDTEIVGPVNLTGPTRATANDLGFSLAMAMNRPYLFRAPQFALRLALGTDMADALLLTDAHVVPEVLLDSGFRFETPTVEDAVEAAVSGSRDAPT